MSLFKDVNVVQYHVSDWERAKQFYTDVLGWPVAFLSDEAGWMEFGEEGKTHLAINRWEESTPVPAGQGGALAVLTVEDAAGTVAALRARGVRCDDAVDHSRHGGLRRVLRSRRQPRTVCLIPARHVAVHSAWR